MMSFEMGTLERRRSVSLQDLRKHKTISLPVRLFQKAVKGKKSSDKSFSEVRLINTIID